MKIIGILMVVTILAVLFARQHAAVERAEPGAHRVYGRALETAHGVADKVRQQQEQAKEE